MSNSILVRNFPDQRWEMYTLLDEIKDSQLCIIYKLVFCIPYEGNEHLLGTTYNSKNQSLGIRLEDGFILKLRSGIAISVVKNLGVIISNKINEKLWK